MNYKLLFLCCLVCVIWMPFPSQIVLGQTSELTKPVLIEQPDLPPIPPALNKSQGKGLVMIKAGVDDQGNVAETEMIKSSRMEILDRFILDWIKGFKYLPRLKENQTSSGFTIITVRYDLSEPSFKGPSPIRSSIQLPNDYVEKIVEASTSEDTKTVVLPKKSLKLLSIPPAIQNLKIKGTAVCKLKIDHEGHVRSVVSVEPETDAKFFQMADRLSTRNPMEYRRTHRRIRQHHD